VSVSDIELGSEYQNAYAAYVDGRLERIAIIQMREYNYSSPTGASRPSETFSFRLPSSGSSSAATTVMAVGVQRLMANGSDSITGVTFDGYSYNYELDKGLPALLHNVTRNEALQIAQGGQVTVDVPWSSAVILNLHW